VHPSPGRAGGVRRPGTGPAPASSTWVSVLRLSRHSYAGTAMSGSDAGPTAVLASLDAIDAFLSQADGPAYERRMVHLSADRPRLRRCTGVDTVQLLAWRRRTISASPPASDPTLEAEADESGWRPVCRPATRATTALSG
jgi:hypothetical protein